MPDVLARSGTGTSGLKTEIVSRMAHISRAVGAYVAARWPEYLVQVLESRKDLRRFLDLEAYESVDRAADDYSHVVKSSDLSKYLAAPLRDSAGYNADTWRRNLTRWLTREKAPVPDMIRRTLTALDSDWLLGLGLAGYKLHAIAMLFQLWKDGRRTELAGAALYAKAIFGDDRWALNDGTRVAAREVLERPFHDATYKFGGERITVTKDASETFTRLAQAAKELWGENGVPSVVRPPRDLGNAPPLHRMWMMIKSATASGELSYEVELKSWQHYIAECATEWAALLVTAQLGSLEQARGSIAARLTTSRAPSASPTARKKRRA